MNVIIAGEEPGIERNAFAALDSRASRRAARAESK